MVFVLLAGFLPLQTARADLTEKIASGVGKVLVGSADLISILLTIIFGVVQMITGVLPYTGAQFLNSCVDLNFVVPLTPSHPQAATNAVALVQAWSYTRGLANILLVIIFAWVAFATILRIKSYEIKTILPRLLIVGILINFIPVITGVIIDITNILTKYFADKSSGAAQWFWKQNPLNNVFDSSNLSSLVPGTGGWTGLATQGALGIVFNIISWGALIMYGLVFLARVAMIWLLVILAPIAWLGYLVPGGKRYWDMWWNQFILWSVIGIPMLFFLYLGGLILSNGMTACNINLNALTGTGGAGNVLEATMAQTMTGILCHSRGFIVALIVLFVGAGMSMTLMPKGAAGIVNQGKKAGTWMRKKGQDQALGRMLGSEKGQKLMQGAAGLNVKPKWGEGQKTAGGWFKRRMAGAVGLVASPLTAAVHAGANEGLKYGAKESKEIDALIKKLEEQYGAKNYKAMANASINPAAYKERIARVLALAKNKGAKGLAEMDQNELRKVIKLMNQYAPHRIEDVVAHMGDLVDDPEVGGIVKNRLVDMEISKADIEELKKQGVPTKEIMNQARKNALAKNKDVKKLMDMGIEEAEAIRGAAFKTAVDALKNSDIENLSSSTLNNAGFQEALVRWKNWSFMRTIMDEKGADYGETLQKAAEGIKGGIENIAKTNPQILNAAYTDAGSMFLRQFKDSTGAIIDKKEDMKAFIKTHR